MTSIYLVRHAQAVGNLERRFQGHTDHPLTPMGILQARSVGHRFQALPIRQVYTSPLRRAYDTAAAIASIHGQAPVREPGLIEINGGDLEDRLFDELSAIYPEEYRNFIEAPHSFTAVGQGETYRQVYERMRDVTLELADRHRGQTIVLVSHGCALRCLLSYAMGLPLQRMNEVPWGQNTGVSHLLFSEASLPAVAYTWDITHLPDAQIT